MQRPYHTTAYRYPGERLILAVTLGLVFVVIAFTAAATLCGSAAFVLIMLGLAYLSTRLRHEELLKRAQPVAPQTTPELAALVGECAARLQPGRVQTFVAPGRVLNAYTFGLSSPKVVVLYAGLLEVMDDDELRFVIGHELGHVRLGHTWLNSLVGGMAGIPSPYLAFAVLRLAFLWWNRACEHSADRAGLLACGQIGKATSALVKLAAGGEARTSEEWERALRRVEAEDDHALSLVAEALTTHPLTVRRIAELRRYAASDAYRRLQALLERNLDAAQNPAP
jgi:Zn-dependent protease with chaperone function